MQGICLISRSMLFMHYKESSFKTKEGFLFLLLCISSVLLCKFLQFSSVWTILGRQAGNRTKLDPNEYYPFISRHPGYLDTSLKESFPYLV